MSPKEKSHNSEKTSLKERVQKNTTEKVPDTLAQQKPDLLALIQRARHSPRSLHPRDVLQLQRALGNQAAEQALTGMIKRQPVSKQVADTSTPEDALVIQRFVSREDIESARSSLRLLYSRHEGDESIRIVVNRAEQAETFWERHMKDESGRYYDLDEVIDGILGRYLSPEEKENYPIEAAFTGGVDQMRVQIVVKDPNVENQLSPEATFFALNQLFKAEEGELKVHIESVTATGKGKKLFRESLLPLFDSLRVKELSLDASQIGGGAQGRIAWARYGFIPTQQDWDKMRKYGLKQLWFFQRWGVYKRMRAIFKDPNPRAIRKFVFLSWQEGGTGTKFLNRVLSHDNWEGTLNLEDQRDRDWIANYTSNADKEAFLGIL